MRSLSLGWLGLACTLGFLTPALAEHPCTSTPSVSGPPKQEVVQPQLPTRQRVEVTTSTSPSGTIEVTTSTSSSSTSVGMAPVPAPQPNGPAQPVVVTEQTWKRVDCK